MADAPHRLPQTQRHWGWRGRINDRHSSTINAGLLKGDVSNLTAVVVPLAFSLMAASAEIIAGVLEYKNGNTFGTVAFTSYGLFWWWYAFTQWTAAAG